MTRRMTIRLAPEDEQWLAEEAADEGLDPAAMVRVILARLRQGRPALYREALASQAQVRVLPAVTDHAALTAAQRVLERHPLNPQMPAPMPRLDVSGEAVEPAQPQALDAVEQAMDDIAGSYGSEEASGASPAAIPLRLVAREKYNPGVR